MRSAATVLATATVLVLGAVTHAQRPTGITPEMIATALPVEGAPLAAPGPYKVESGPAFGSPGQAAKMFVGKDCRLCTDPNWDTASKQLQ